MKTKKLFSLLLVICICFCIIGTSAEAAETENVIATDQYENISWIIYESGVLCIGGTGDMPDFSSGTPWSSYAYGIWAVKISEGITSISHGAFSDLQFLERILIPISVTTIEDNAFSTALKIKHVYYGGTSSDWSKINCTDSENSALLYAIYHYNRIDIPENYIDYDCGDNLTWTLDDNGVLEIHGTGDMWNFDSDNRSPWYDFRYNNDFRYNIKKIKIADGVTSIGDSAFSGCSNALSITIPDSVTHIGAWAFSACSSIVKINLPPNLISIGEQAFGSCTSLKQIILPDGVKSIEDRAFYACMSLKSIYIPKSVNMIGSEAFFRATEADLYYEGSENEWNNIDIGYNSIPGTATIHYNSSVPAPLPDYTVNIEEYSNDYEFETRIVSRTENNTSEYLNVIIYSAVHSKDGILKGCDLTAKEIEGGGWTGSSLYPECGLESGDTIVTYVWTEDMKPLAKSETIVAE